MISCRSRAHAAWPLASRVGSAGAETEIREGEVRREGGMGQERAREKVFDTVVRRARTWRRVRRGLMGGFLLLGSLVRGAVAAGDVVGGASSSSFGGSVANSWAVRPSGTNCDMAGWRSPVGERLSTRERVSPRRSSTS